MKRVAIVDYGMGNLDSVARAFQECGATTVVTERRSELESVGALVLPGVGSFADGMQNIRERGLDLVLREQVFERRIPILGLCLGMQLLAESGSEGGPTQGLGWIPGRVVRLEPHEPSERVPHVGWNAVQLARPSALFQAIPSGKDFYFVHSYHVVAKNPQDVLARTPYAGGFVSSVGRDDVYGVQFHPEKSQRLGFQVIRNFLSL